MSLPEDVARQAALIRQLQGALSGNRVVRGTVSAAGTLANGEGWTCVKNATGDYTVTFTTPFASAPVVVPGVGESAGTLAAKLKNAVSPTASAFTVNTFNTATSALTDSIWTFVAVGP